jgi:putative toxin-antitoxin system antitoxin component (TIGR02293 family)
MVGQKLAKPTLTCYGQMPIIERQMAQNAPTPKQAALSSGTAAMKSAARARNGASDSPSTSFVRAFEHLVGNDSVRTVRQGLEISAVEAFVRSGAISYGEIYAIVMPRKTLSNRRTVGTLTADQSDKLVRVGRIISKAETTFGSAEKAAQWLRRPTQPLNGEQPLRMLDTEAGARVVEELLLKIDHGIAA